MLIRSEQENAFRLAVDREYEIRVTKFLREQFPDAAQEAKATLLEGVREQVAHARRYGLLTEQHIATYVTSAWLLGDDFDSRFPAALQMLSSTIAPDEKSDWLEWFTSDLFEQLEGHS